MANNNQVQVTVADVTATKQSQVHLTRSTLPYSEEVRALEARIAETPNDHLLWMQKGLALSKQMLFREAIEAYSMALTIDPFHALTYRHRGHRLLSVHRFAEAAADLALSARLDPTNWDTLYHLGLAHYLLEDYAAAAEDYEACLKLSHTGEQIVPVVDWYWMTAKRLGDEKKAAELLRLVTPETDPGENGVYKRRILMYKGLIRPEELMQLDGVARPELELASQGYGLANYYYLNGEVGKCNDLLAQILESRQFWAAFGYLAALVDARRRGLPCANIDF